MLSALNIESAALAGLSQGGFLSMRAALLAPKRVSALVLLATRSGIDDDQTVGNFRALSWNGQTTVPSMCRVCSRKCCWGRT